MFEEQLNKDDDYIEDIGIEQLKQAMPLMWDDQKKMFGME